MANDPTPLPSPTPALPMVCGRQIAVDPAYVPQSVYQGRTIYFCTEFCRNAFLADPERFYAAHSRQYQPVQPIQESQETT